MSKSKPGARSDAQLTAAAQRRRAAARLLEGAHAGIQVWRLCRHKDCRRRRACCGGEVDLCGMFCAPKAWTWVRKAVAELRQGAPPYVAMRVAERAAPRRRMTVMSTGRNGKPVLLAARDDGSMGPLVGPLRPTVWARQLARLVGPRGTWLRGAL